MSITCPGCQKTVMGYQMKKCPFCGYDFENPVYGIKKEPSFSDLAKEIKAINEANKPKVTCPFCQSTNCKKISGASKVGKVALFGVFAAGNVSKTWHCNNCGSNFG